ncbi:hypothetical protein [Dyadobacter luticola]|uniref:Uncharacterized protein n=1 Tax=Dyadobacter luticola TaxID=1979387 RepID=A0A5R9L6E2_9BACT|nr:hypothetical protein [Dyadobacter luticola]TLV03840.1 hypothetical protein FEN17_09670 [Dyadobacter luticola]
MRGEKKLIIKIIDNLARKHQDMSFKYGYNESFAEHIIEVEPLERYKADDYMVDECDAISKFISVYPDKEIAFVHNDLFLKVENPTYHIGPKSANTKLRAMHSPARSFWSNLGRALGF